MAYVEPRDVPQVAGYNPNAGGVSPTDAAQAASKVQPYTRSGKTKPQLLKSYRKRVAMSRKWRKDEGFDDTWDRLVDMYSNKQFEDNDPTQDDDMIAVNVSFSTVNTIGPGVSVSYPTISVNPQRPELEDAANGVEAMVNYWFRHYDWRTETRRVVKDSLCVGHGWAKVWWKYATTQRPLTSEEAQQQFDQANAAAGDHAEQNPEEAHEVPTPDELQQQLPTTKSETLVDQPCVERVSFRDMLVDPESTCEGDLKWIAQRIVRPLSEVKSDPSYNSAARRKVQADAGTNPRWRDDEDDDSIGGGATHDYNDDVQRVTLYEFYDLRLRYYCVFAVNGGDAFLVEPTELPYPYGHPFVYLGNYDVPDRFYDVGDLEALEPLQLELNAVRSDMRNHRKRWQRAYLALRDKFDSDSEAALESDRDGRIVWIDGDEDLSRIVAPIPQVPLDAQMYQYSQQIEDDINLVSGVSEYQRGAMSEIRRTATEAAMIGDASNARAADKLAQVEVFLQEVARRVVQLAQKYLTGDHVVSIIGTDGAKQWLPYDNSTIQGEFDFVVEAGSTQPQDENFKRQQALQLAQTLSPFVGSTVDPTALVMYVLKDGFGVKNPEQFLMQQQPPQGPSEKLIETLSYKDAPPDIQRQMEAQAGFTPSAIGPAPPQQGGAPAPAPDDGSGGGVQLTDPNAVDPSAMQQQDVPPPEALSPLDQEAQQQQAALMQAMRLGNLTRQTDQAH